MRTQYLKELYPVKDILRRYGVEISGGRCRGFCHDGQDYNMAVRDDNCYCYVCNRAFDIFDIVQFFERCDFAKAFVILGGNARPSFSARRHIARVAHESARKKTEAEAMSRRRRVMEGEWALYDYILREKRPRSPDEITDEYIIAAKNIPRVEYHLDCLEAEAVTLHEA